jgi:hypothetical protein
MPTGRDVRWCPKFDGVRIPTLVGFFLTIQSPTEVGTLTPVIRRATTECPEGENFQFISDSIARYQERRSDEVWRGGTGVPPVNHAQDARATLKLHQ